MSSPTTRDEARSPRLQRVDVPGPVLLLTALLLGSLALFLKFPPLQEVTTTPEAPPRFQAVPPGDVEYREQFTELQRRAYPDLAPLALDDSVGEVYTRALGAAAEMEGWEVVFESDSLHALQAVAETGVLGFRDDVVVEVRPAERGSEVHVRSRSRLGRTDFGTNARRIRAYLKELE